MGPLKVSSIRKHTYSRQLSASSLIVIFPPSGGTVLGLVSDCMGKRAPAVTASLVLAMGALVGYSREY